MIIASYSRNQRVGEAVGATMHCEHDTLSGVTDE
jgi:hypothetical protein